MSMLKSASHFPYASLCAAVALACSLVACGGGGGGSPAGTDGGDSSGISRSPSSSANDEQKQVASDHTPDTVPSSTDSSAENVSPESQSLHYGEGRVIDTQGKVYTGEQWFKHLQQHCARESSGKSINGEDPMPSIRCFAGTYMGLGLETSLECRVTLAEDGSVSFLFNGADRKLMNLSADNSTYRFVSKWDSHGGETAFKIYGKGDPASSSGRKTDFALGHLSGRAQAIHNVSVDMLSIYYEDSDIDVYQGALGTKVSDTTCLIFTRSLVTP